ncbi:isoprenyl transferase [Pseudahrensia aquimaris]|uniref:Isoprenyl transferase n=1 Tax=Pseudahrensia aquimaris TaxID=744461 RepID=A0ABW3FI95_9HYPH
MNILPDMKSPNIAASVPRHIGIIMDGNGRWAQARGLTRSAGHRKGVDAVRRAIRACGELGVETVTLFSFSSENWSRPAGEVNDLMGLLKMFIRRDLADLHKEGVKVCVIGSRTNVPADILPLIEEAEKLTFHNTAQRLVIAFNYGARDEIVRATQKLAAQVAAGELAPSDISVEAIDAALDTSDWSDPELIIRTSGEQRLSNFLLWQAAYSELVFLDVLWPDFDKTHLQAALAEFSARDRRFGGVVVQAAQ